MRFVELMLMIWSVQLCLYCNSSTTAKVPADQHDAPSDTATQVYTSKNLVIKKISPHAYQHISYLNTNDFGKVSCNGMVIVNNNEAIVFDTPAGNESSRELIDYLEKELRCSVKAIVPTHFHSDCLGGLDIFHQHGISSFANERTIEAADKHHFSLPQNGFKNQMEFNIGGDTVFATFLGEGHTKDNIVGYFPGDKIMFGGCLIKETGAGKGNLADADTALWPATVEKVKATYPETKIVIPGHGAPGGTALLDYTIQLFKGGDTH